MRFRSRVPGNRGATGRVGEAAQQLDEPNEAGASDEASQVIQVLKGQSFEPKIPRASCSKRSEPVGGGEGFGTVSSVRSASVKNETE